MPSDRYFMSAAPCLHIPNCRAAIETVMEFRLALIEWMDFSQRSEKLTSSSTFPAIGFVNEVILPLFPVKVTTEGFEPDSAFHNFSHYRAFITTPK